MELIGGAQCTIFIASIGSCARRWLRARAMRERQAPPPKHQFSIGVNFHFKYAIGYGEYQMITLEVKLNVRESVFAQWESGSSATSRSRSWR
jgi:hypothetical protein